MNAKTCICFLVVASTTWLASSSFAWAGDGVLLSPSSLPAAERASLVDGIKAAKGASPASFQAVAQLRSRLPELDAAKRGRYVAVAPILKELGADGLYPMLEQIAVDAQPRGALSGSAWVAWRAGLIEAVGNLRDPRAAAVLAAVLDSPQTEFPIVRAAAEAYGKLGTDAAATKLINLSRVSGPKRSAVLAGMGACRRSAVANELARVLAQHPAGDLAGVVVHSLGDAGSLWAWRTSAVSATGEGSTTRSIAAQALMDAFVHYDGDVREEATKALMVVAEPSTPALIASARAGASSELLAALAQLEQRITNNPVW